jgi:hypothetical protein
MSEMLSFLGGTDPVEPLDAPVVEPTAEPAAEAPQGGPVRDEAGRFASTAAPEPVITTDPVVEPVLEQPAPVEPPSGHVPLSVVQAERDRRQNAERELEALRKQSAPAQPAPQPQAIPDRWDDPDGYEAYQAEQQQAAILNVKLDLSEDMARGKHGEDLVDAAKAWALQRFEQSPAYRQEVLSHRNPYEKAVLDYRRDQVATEVQPDELEEYRAWKATKANPAPQPIPAPAALAPAPAPRAAPPPPPRSIAAAPSAGGPAHVPSGPGQAFAAVFSSKG